MGSRAETKLEEGLRAKMNAATERILGGLDVEGLGLQDLEGLGLKDLEVFGLKELEALQSVSAVLSGDEASAAVSPTAPAASAAAAGGCGGHDDADERRRVKKVAGGAVAAQGKNEVAGLRAPDLRT